MGNRSTKIVSASEEVVDGDLNNVIIVKRSVLDVVNIMLPVYFSRQAITENGNIIQISIQWHRLI